MYTITYDKIKNRVYVVFESLPYGDELQKYANELLGKVNECKKDYTILFDMTRTKAKVVSDDDISGLKAAKQHCVQIGMKKCAFAIQSFTVRMQISRYLKDTEPKDGYYDNAEEADRFLDE